MMLNIRRTVHSLAVLAVLCTILMGTPSAPSTLDGVCVPTTSGYCSE